MTKRIYTTCLAVLVCVTWCETASSGAKARRVLDVPETSAALYGPLPDRHPKQPKYWSHGERVSVGTAGSASGPPGTVIGLTYDDRQTEGSPGRQIDEHDGSIFVAFVDTEAEDTLALLGGAIQWNRIAVIGSPTSVSLDNGESVRVLPLGTPLTPEGTELFQPGYSYSPNVRFLPDGRAEIVYLWTNVPRPLTALENVKNTGTFSPGFPEAVSGGFRPIFPHNAVQTACGDTLIHMVATNEPAGEHYVWYWRGVVSGASVAWSTPLLIDTAGWYTPVIEAHGNTVAMVYTRQMTDWSHEFLDAEVVYRLSTDCGTTWGPAESISNYSALSDERANLRVAAVFDDDGVLHVIWETRAYDHEQGIYLRIPCRLNHWNSARQTTRRITFADWSNNAWDGSCSHQTDYNGMGARHGSITNFNLAIKPAGDGPGTGIPDELLYAVWVQGGPTTDDCAAQDYSGTPGGIVNAEIYMSVTSDDGLTWDRPQNLTGTRTPNCLPGDCHSEQSLSAAARADSGIYLSFVDDTHAGAPPDPKLLPWAGLWTESHYMVMAVEARSPIPSAVIGLESEMQFMELNVGTSGSNTVDIELASLGNASLNFEVQVTGDNGGQSHVTVNGGTMYTGSIAPGGASEIVTVEFDGIGLPDPSEHIWRVEITSNDSLNNPGQGGVPIDINLNVFVSDSWYTCTQDTISTGLHRLAVSSCLELGDKNRGGGMESYAAGSEWLYDASPLLAWQDGPTKRVYRDIHWTSLEDRSRDSNRAFRAQSDIAMVRDTSIVSGESTYVSDVARGVATSTDSLFQVDWEAVAFKHPSLSHGSVMKYTVTNRTATTYTGLMLGAAADLDVDSMFDANDGIADMAKQWIGAQGGWADTGGFVPQTNYAALFYIPLVACSDQAAGGQVLDNVEYIYPEGGYNTDSLYEIMARCSTWDATTFPADTASDVNVVLVDRRFTTLAPDDTLTFAFGLALSDISIEDLDSTIFNLRGAVNSECLNCPIVVAGDVNESGTLTSADIIYLVNYVFKAGPLPLPCEASGDVNCTGAVTSSDVIYLVNHVFKAGPLPCEVCDLISSGTLTCD